MQVDAAGPQQASLPPRRLGLTGRIWEKKYGKNAKHVVKNNELEKKKAEEQVVSATKNAYARRAQVASTAASTSRHGPSTEGAARAAPSAHGASGAREPTTTSKPAAPASGAQGLHPSWAAAKMRQKQLAEGPKATKIVFD